MPQNFLGCDREQVFLMPPDPRDWLPEEPPGVVRFGDGRAVDDKDGHRGSLSVLPALAAEGGLPLRVWQSLPAAHFEALLDADAPRRADYSDHDPGATVRIGYVKVFMDGTLGSRTARLLDGSGVEVTSTAQLIEHIRRAAAHRLTVAVHAIGDQAVRNALDAFERTRETWLLSDSGTGSSTPSAFTPMTSRASPDSASRLRSSLRTPRATGTSRTRSGDRAAHSYPYRSLMDAGALLVGGSDAPCEEVDPLAGIRAAVLRTSDGREPWRPEQSISATEALASFTRNPAWLEGARPTAAG